MRRTHVDPHVPQNQGVVKRIAISDDPNTLYARGFPPRRSGVLTPLEEGEMWLAHL